MIFVNLFQMDLDSWLFIAPSGIIIWVAFSQLRLILREGSQFSHAVKVEWAAGKPWENYGKDNKYFRVGWLGLYNLDTGLWNAKPSFCFNLCSFSDSGCVGGCEWTSLVKQETPLIQVLQSILEIKDLGSQIIFKLVFSQQFLTRPLWIKSSLLTPLFLHVNAASQASSKRLKKVPFCTAVSGILIWTRGVSGELCLKKRKNRSDGIGWPLRHFEAEWILTKIWVEATMITTGFLTETCRRFSMSFFGCQQISHFGLE